MTVAQVAMRACLTVINPRLLCRYLWFVIQINNSAIRV